MTDPLLAADKAAASQDSSAGKALALLDAFAGPRAVLGVSELATQLKIPKSTAHRLLCVLIESGYVRRTGDRYCLTGRAFELGNQVRVCRPNGLRDRAVPYMAELFALTGETIHLAVLAGTDILYVDKVFGHHSTRCGTYVGARRPAYTTGLGKAILAFAAPAEVERSLTGHFQRYTAYTVPNASALLRSIDKVRADGFATDFEESFVGLSCVAVPILSPVDQVAVGAISLTTVATKGSLARYKVAMVKAAEQLSSQLRHQAA